MSDTQLYVFACVHCKQLFKLEAVKALAFDHLCPSLERVYRIYIKASWGSAVHRVLICRRVDCFESRQDGNPYCEAHQEPKETNMIHDEIELGERHNDGKLRYSLLSVCAIRELVKVLAFGARKYADHNWRKGLSWTETVDSLLRHVEAWREGEDLDSETGCHHLAHAMCNAMFLVEFWATGVGVDDRYKRKEVAEHPQPGKFAYDRATLQATCTPAIVKFTPSCNSKTDNCNCQVNTERNVRYREHVRDLQQKAALQCDGALAENKTAVLRGDSERDENV